MKRRTFIAGLGSAAAWPLVARGQQPEKPTVGILESSQPSVEFEPSFARGLKDAGFVDGQNVIVAATPFRLDSGHLCDGDGRLFDEVVYEYGIARGSTGLACKAQSCAASTCNRRDHNDRVRSLDLRRSTYFFRAARSKFLAHDGLIRFYGAARSSSGPPTAKDARVRDRCYRCDLLRWSRDRDGSCRRPRTAALARKAIRYNGT
jgi:hypothetical protein